MIEKEGKLAAHCKVVCSSPFSANHNAWQVGLPRDEAGPYRELLIGGGDVAFDHMLPNDIQIFQDA